VAEQTALRVLVVGGSWYWQEAVLRVLERRDGFVPVAATGAEAARLAAAEPFDVAIVDLDDASGMHTLAELREHDVPCIAISGGRGQSEVVAALNASASYAVRSELDPDRLSYLVRVAASGDALFVQASRRALESLAGVGGDSVSRFGLTPRELDVLRLVADGRTNAEIARDLHLAPSSVKKLVSRCLAKLGVRNRVEAALVARRELLVPVGGPFGTQPDGHLETIGGAFGT
jgi:DNA-binding NarL/FixJ family response regulator